MKIRIETNDGHILEGRFISKGEYTLLFSVDKNEQNKSCVAELVANDFPWLCDITEYSDHWGIIVRKSDIERITTE